MKISTNSSIIQDLVLLVFFAAIFPFLGSGCAQIGSPTGGPKDTLAPVLVKSIPIANATQFDKEKIILSFDEYIEIQDLSSNLLISPFPKNNPTIQSNLKNISIRFKDSLLPNTTYKIQFGNAIKDVNEGNVLRDFEFVFSTGPHIDSLLITGKISLAETGKIDSTLVAMLFVNAKDSSVQTRKPDYISKLNGDGNFTFKNLPNLPFRLYALKDGDGNKFYNAETEVFAFTDTQITPSLSPNSVSLLAYASKKIQAESQNQSQEEKKDKNKYLKYTNNLLSGKQDFLHPLEIEFASKLAIFESDSVVVCDTSWKPISNVNKVLDSNRKKLTIQKKWVPGERVNVLFFKKGISDSAGLSLFTNDTLKFLVKEKQEYGSLKLEFQGLDIKRKPVLQFVEGNEVKRSVPLNTTNWEEKLILPGEYEFSVLYDENKNGKWDAGNYKSKQQPEQTLAIPQKINVKADWENERTITL